MSASAINLPSSAPGECYAGKALLGDVISFSKCNMQCNDDATQFCGGGKAMTVSRSAAGVTADRTLQIAD